MGFNKINLILCQFRAFSLGIDVEKCFLKFISEASLQSFAFVLDEKGFLSSNPTMQFLCFRLGLFSVPCTAQVSAAVSRCGVAAWGCPIPRDYRRLLSSAFQPKPFLQRFQLAGAAFSGPVSYLKSDFPSLLFESSSDFLKDFQWIVSPERQIC